MTNNNDIVTEQRYAQGLTYQEFLDQAKVNLDRFQQNYETAVIDPSDKEFFENIVNREGGPSKVLVIGEDWCPDVYRGMPVIARIAEASGMEMRVFPRDANLDIMNQFLKDGLHQSIPTFVFYTEDNKYLCHWIERPAQATKEMAEITTRVQKEMAGAEENDIRSATRQGMLDRYPEWQQLTIEELRTLLADNVS